MTISLFSGKARSNKTSAVKSEVTTAEIEKEEDATCEADNELGFEDLGVEKWLVNTLSTLSIERPTSIQKKCIPSILKGYNVIGSAKTGQGKTAAFGLPMLQTLSKDPFGVFSLVLTPTRELAIQIAEQFKVFGKEMTLKTAVIVGGLDMTQQALALEKRPHLVIATPGRLKDLLETSCSDVSLSNLKFLVLDEADRLLESTFSPDLQFILSKLPKSRQTLLFSATMNKHVEKYISIYSNERRLIVHKDNEKYDTVAQLNQKYLLIPSKVKDAYLFHLLQGEFMDKTIIIFVGKCKTCELLKVTLKELGISSVTLHSMMKQNDRIASIARFKSGSSKILISTDVASRGLDIPTVQVVCNYDIPADPKDYIHRIGRTARAGKGGVALSIVCEIDVDLIKSIEAKTKKTMDEFVVDEKHVLPLLTKVLSAKRVASMYLIDNNFDERKRKYSQV